MSEFKRIAKFEIVSKEQFFNSLDYENKEEIYSSLKLPKRATKGSAGYDFYAPFNITLKPGETIKIPTGIRVYMEENYGNSKFIKFNCVSLITSSGVSYSKFTSPLQSFKTGELASSPTNVNSCVEWIGRIPSFFNKTIDSSATAFNTSPDITSPAFCKSSK